ncbi:hypothetical protein KUTeg_016660 [Tegillarca granosa]|uniref:Uncharacterized protein n=1 Tax=Tegillarca granosa TaxID=220873 RepID=A0ABQ9ERD0_TEGGR|nr:hypothetical protein KUTeg_016660 [Tegillarca granosa]
MASPSFLASPNMPGAGSSGTGLAHQLPKLTSETELQKLLADERMRSQMHKTNFEQLKEEHRRLQDEYSRLEDEIKKTIEESKIVQEKYKSMYEQSRKEVTDLTSELEEVKSKVVTPKRLEIMRMQIVEQVEKTYKERYQKQDQEIEEYRTAMNKIKVDEVTHKSKVEATNVKMDMLKQRGDLERERDKLANIVEDMQTKLEISKHTIDQQSRALSEKERDVVRRVQAAREEEFIKLAKVENEKLELETKLQENDKRRIDEDAYRHAEKEKMEERIRAANDAKDAAEREVLILKTKLSHHHSVDDQLERERSENSELKSKIHRLESELSSFGDREHDITDESIRLRNQVELLKEELKLTKSQLHKIQDNHDLIISQQKTAFIDDKSQLELRVHELQEKLGQVQKKYQKALLMYKKYKKKSLYVIDNVKDKLALMEAKNEELSLEKKALEQCVPQDTFNRLKKQWKDLQRRHNEFRRVLLCGVTQIICLDLSSEMDKVTFRSRAGKKNVELPHVEGDQTVIPPPFIVRTLLVYGRSYCQIDFKGKEEIFDRICDLDEKGQSFIFESARNPTRLYDQMAQLLAHPLQRPHQTDISYRLHNVADVDNLEVV